MNPPGYPNYSEAPTQPSNLQAGFGVSFQAGPGYPPYSNPTYGGGDQGHVVNCPYPTNPPAMPYPPSASAPMLAPAPLQQTVSYPTNTNQNQPPPPPDWKGEILNFDPQIQPPTNPFWNPNFDDPCPYSPPPIQTKQTEITEEEARLALEEYAKSKCCYGKPTNITLGQIQMENVFKYELSTITEMRKTQWKFEPYTSQSIPGPVPVPNAWDISVVQDSPFSEGKKKQEIPGTASVRPCQTCWGGGRSRCAHCGGMGFKNCTWCNGSGRRMDDACNSCNSRGRENCTWCHGQGSGKCVQCNGRGQVYAYLELVVSWKLNKEEFITEETSSRGGEVVPKKKLSGSTGSVVYEDSRDRLFPLGNFPNETLTQASKRILESHNKLQTNDVLIRRQKHLVEVLPIASVDYNCKGKSGTFRIYGKEHKVFFPEYPNSGCCSIA